MNKWIFPIDEKRCPGVPINPHPGSFGAVRKYDIHCGVDLYCNNGQIVFAVEDGTIVRIEPFTGKNADCDWWLDTMCVKIEGQTGIICYGEIEPFENINVGDKVVAGQMIGYVVPVLPDRKFRRDIKGHSCSMLHVQIYKHGNLESCLHERPEDGIDPTEFLLNAMEDKRTI